MKTAKDLVEAGVKEIDDAKWKRKTFRLDDGREQEIGAELVVHDEEGRPVICYLNIRPKYCDRGHFDLRIDGYELYLDDADRFPRYFFSAEEADKHTRAFLKWRIWRHDMHNRLLDDLFN